MQVNKAFEVFAKDIILRSSSHVECVVLITKL
jgi:hypothetical protein